MVERTPHDAAPVLTPPPNRGGCLRAVCRRCCTPVIVACIGLGLVGCLAVYNATYHLENPFHYVGRQIGWLLVAIILIMIVSSLLLRQIRMLLWVAAPLVYASLWLVLRFGIRINGMHGWFAWRGIHVQPSDIGKPIFVLALAALMEITAPHRQDAVRGYLPVLGLLACWLLPIAFEADIGTILVYVFTFALVYACMAGPLRHLWISLLGGLPILALWVVFGARFGVGWAGLPDAMQRVERLERHVVQFQRTLAAGGLFGQSWGKAVWSQTYLPFGYSDSIFATIGESVGFLGAMPLVFVIVLWVIYGYRRIQHARGYFTACAITGMVVIIAAQALMHLSVNLGMLPPMGMPLPLLGYGGSSLIATVISVGIVEALSRRVPAFANPLPASEPRNDVPPCNDPKEQ